MTRRWFDPAFFTDEKLAKASLEERYLFASMIANQDDDGRLLGHPGYLRSIAFPYENFTIEEVRKMRDHLAEVNPNIIIYNNGGDEYIQLRRHQRYQKPRYYHASKFPAPPNWPFDEEPLKNDYKGDNEKAIQYQIANKIRNGQWQPTNEQVTNVEINKRLGNLYVDIFATTVSQTYILIEIKQYPLQFRDLGQITDYRTEAESRGYKPVKAFLIGNGLGNLGLKEAFAASVTPLNVDLTTIDAVKPTGDFVTPTSGDVRATTDVTKYTEDRVGLGGAGSGQDLDLDKGKAKGIPAVSPAQTAAGKSDLEKPDQAEKTRPEKFPQDRVTKIKPCQRETGVFLDLVEAHIGVRLVQRDKLQGIIRPLLVKVPEATPEKLLECFKWLKDNDPYYQSRDSPTAIMALPSKYPEWAAGRLRTLQGKERYARHKEQQRDPIQRMREAGWDTGDGANQPDDTS